MSGSHLRTGAAPPGNSVAERFILTMKSELMWTPDWKLPHELRAALVQWLDVYDNEQPQQALGWKTPRETRGGPQAAPDDGGVGNDAKAFGQEVSRQMRDTALRTPLSRSAET